MPPIRQPGEHREFLRDARQGRPASQHSLRSNATAAPSRVRTQRDLFAPSLSRRPTTSATPHIQAEVLADSGSSDEDTVDLRQRQLRRIRHGSPAGKISKSIEGAVEEQDIVNRQPDGNYLLNSSMQSVMVPQTSAETEEDVAAKELDERYAAMGRAYFSSGLAAGAKTIKKYDEDLEDSTPEMMARLREHVTSKIEDERWMFEPVGRHQTMLS